MGPLSLALGRGSKPSSVAGGPSGPLWEGMAGDAGRLASVSDQAWQVQTGVKEVGPQGLWEGSSGLPDEVYWPCSHSREIPSFPSQLEWKIGLPWANTRGILNSPS